MTRKGPVSAPGAVRGRQEAQSRRRSSDDSGRGQQGSRLKMQRCWL